MASPGPDTSPSELMPPCVLVLNHHRDALGDVTAALSRAGFDVREADSLAQSCRLLSQVRPDVVVLNPLVLAAGGVELELLENLQKEDDPVPVILLVDDLQALSETRGLRLPFRDFLLKPHLPAECVHRIELALLTRRKFRALHTRARQLEGQVSVDFKTGLLSELYFKRLLSLEWKRAQRHQNPLSLMLVDIDNFKAVNDTLGHAEGDALLRRVGRLTTSMVRSVDTAARLGGDEFALLLPETDRAGARRIAEKLHRGMKEELDGTGLRVSASIGAAAFPATPSTFDDALKFADELMYTIKRGSKDAVMVEDYAGPSADQHEYR